MNRLIATLTLVAAFGLGAARAAETFEYDVALDSIPGPGPQSPTAVWQYFEASFDRTAMTHLTDWDLAGNEVFDTFPQWDNNLVNGKYPFVQMTGPGGPFPGNFGSASFPGNSLFIHPSNGAGAPGAAVGFYNDRSGPVTLTFNVTFTIVQNVNNADGVRYYIQVQTVGDPNFVAVADGFIDKSNLAATESRTGLVLQPGQFVYFGVDNGGPNNNYFWDHTRLQLTVTATSLDSAPVITRQPQGVAVLPGAEVTLTVEAASLLPLSYQWQKNGVNIAGATASQLVLRNVSQQDTADYRVVVSNERGSTPSETARVTVALEPVLSLQLNPGIVVVGTMGFRYRVEYREALEPPTTWHLLQGIPSLPTSPFVVYDPTPVSPNNKRFYRALLVP